MNTVLCETSDSKIWNIERFVADLVQASQTGPVIVDMNSEGPCLATLGLEQIISSLSSITVDHILTSNQISSSPYKEVRSPFVELEIVQKKLKEFQPQLSSLHHRFGIFIGRSNWIRLGLASFLHEYHKQQTWFLYHYDNVSDYHLANFGLETLLQKQWSMRHAVFDFVEQLPIRSDKISYPILFNTGALDLHDPYASIFCEVVCETYFSGKTFMMTEKIMRPILQRRPFVIQGPKHYIDNLKLLGFQTFDNWWDESYNTDDPDGQFEGMCWTLNHIGQQSDQTIRTWYQEMQPVLEHNAQVLMSLTSKQILQTVFRS